MKKVIYPVNSVIQSPNTRARSLTSFRITSSTLGLLFYRGGGGGGCPKFMIQKGGVEGGVKTKFQV